MVRIAALSWTVYSLIQAVCRAVLSGAIWVQESMLRRHSCLHLSRRSRAAGLHLQIPLSNRGDASHLVLTTWLSIACLVPVSPRTKGSRTAPRPEKQQATDLGNPCKRLPLLSNKAPVGLWQHDKLAGVVAGVSHAGRAARDCHVFGMCNSIALINTQTWDSWLHLTSYFTCSSLVFRTWRTISSTLTTPQQH